MTAIFFMKICLIFFVMADACDLDEIEGILTCLESGKLSHQNNLTFLCYEAKTKGPCEDGEILVLDEFDQCKGSKCIDQGGCEEDQLLYEENCYNKTWEDLMAPCEQPDDLPIPTILFSDDYGNVTCTSGYDLDFQYYWGTRNTIDIDIVPFIKDATLEQGKATFSDFRSSICGLLSENEIAQNKEFKKMCDSE